jgi:hypothetical protein
VILVGRLYVTVPATTLATTIQECRTMVLQRMKEETVP